MDNFLTGFKKRAQKKEIRISVVGLGYVGLPLAVEFAKKGFFVFGIDVDKDRINHIHRKESYIADVSTRDLRKVLDKKRFRAQDDFLALRKSDVVIICVPTPLKRKYHPDISYIKQAVNSVSGHIKKGGLVILESTTYPGTTEEVILPLLESKGLKCGEDFYLAFSPERIDPGNAKYPVRKIPKVIGGVTKEATELAACVYKEIINKIVPVSSARVAEAVKLLENTFRLINIGLIDELAMMAQRMGIDIWEVIAAAKTKPFGFMPFYPGPGVGGHCLDKSEILYIKDKNSLKIMPISDCIKHFRKVKNNIDVLSFDPITKRGIFKRVMAASARPYAGEMIHILTEDGRSLKVTDLHPMFVWDNGKWQLKYAKDLKEGDCLPLSLKLPRFDYRSWSNVQLDLLKEIQAKGQYLIGKIRVKPVGFSWRNYQQQIKSILRRQHNGRLPDCFWDYLSENYLPLKYFYILEKSERFDHSKLTLVTGRGPSRVEILAKTILNEDFCRLIGYYLSEGCYTKDKSARIRFSFNRSEKEYIQDVIDIVHHLGIRTSIYESKKWHTTCIKVSSELFGFLIYEVLGCGKNSYTMSIPERIFSLGKTKKMALLSGILRGDACVEHFFGKWRYRKNEKEYFHNVNTAHITFFTSSRRLFQQLIILLHDLGILPTFQKRKYTLSIFGYKQLAFFKDLFAGRKKDILERYLDLNKNRPKNKSFRRIGRFAVVKVKSVCMTKGDWVYSLETDKPHTFVTSYGIAVHNCIPKDPLYLYWKAKKFGFRSRFIKLASDIITSMPEYVVQRISSILNKQGTALNKANILVIGVTYKKDVRDLRKSPSLDVIEIMQKNGVKVSYFDPLIPYLKFNHTNLRSIDLNEKNLKEFDCVVIATEHSCIDYQLILKNAKTIFDARNLYYGIKSPKVIKL